MEKKVETAVETVSVNQVNRAKNKGFSLMEFLIYMVLVGLAIVVVMAMYSKNSNTNNAKTMATDLQSISSGLKSSYASDDKGYETVSNKDACSLGLLMSTLSFNKSCTDNTVKNKFNGKFEILPGTAVGDKTSSFTIAEDMVPSEVINKTLAQIGTDGVLGIAVGDSGSAPATCVFTAGVTGSKDAGGCDDTTASGFSATKLAGALNGKTNGSFIISYGM